MAAVAICAVALAAGFALKARCAAIAWDGSQYEQLCYNDVQALYDARGVADNVFPYVGGAFRSDELVGGAIEYPVLTGVFMWASGLLVSTADAYLAVSAALLAPFGLLVAYLLGRVRGARALLWAGAPAIVLYAFHNWDLLVVAAAVAGFWLWARGRDVGAAIAFGIGAALKLYPLFFLVPLVLERIAARDRRGALRAAGAGVGVCAVANLPFAVINPSGWWATYEFHRARAADFNSIWMWGMRTGGALRSAVFDAQSIAFDVDRLNAVTALLTATFFVAALAFGWWRARRDGIYPFVQVSAAMLAAFLLWNKVHSPQYALWLLPFFVLVGVHVAWWVAYSLADAVVYVGIFRWFYEFGTTQDAAAMSAAKWALVWGVRGRAVLLLLLFGAFLAARDALAPRRAEVQITDPSQPCSTVTRTEPARPAPG